MDTTAQYIKQCEQAREIQESWRWVGGDWWVQTDTKVVYCIPSKTYSHAWRGDRYMCMYDPPELTRYLCIWLPRQDQLQDMVILTFDIWQKLDHFADMGWLDGYAYFGDSFEHIDTYEKAWLCFVMYHEHKKLWDKEKEQWNCL